MKDDNEEKTMPASEEINRINAGPLNDLLPNYYSMRVHKRKKHK